MDLEVCLKPESHSRDFEIPCDAEKEAAYLLFHASEMCRVTLSDLVQHSLRISLHYWAHLKSIFDGSLDHFSWRANLELILSFTIDIDKELGTHVFRNPQ